MITFRIKADVSEDHRVVLTLPPEVPTGPAELIVTIESPPSVPKGRKPGERLLKLAGPIDDLPADMARNHDHYFHGAPKR